MPWSDGSKRCWIRPNPTPGSGVELLGTLHARGRGGFARLYEFVIERGADDGSIAERALDAIKAGIRTLETTPFTCRKSSHGSPFLRELVIPFGAGGYVALFGIDDAATLTVLVVRHQRASDYH